MPSAYYPEKQIQNPHKKKPTPLAPVYNTQAYHYLLSLDKVIFVFNYTLDHIKTDFEPHGKSSILEKIIKKKESTGVIVHIKIQKGSDALGMLTVS